MSFVKYRIVKLKKAAIAIMIALFYIIKKDSIKLKRTYINTSNKLVLIKAKKYKAEDILVIMPHCLQSSACIYNIAHNLDNCIECGKCDIKDLKFIFREKKIAFTVATGGTAARNSVINARPKFIIASACERDLFSGLYEIKKILCYGIINDRPNGPCKDTKININELKGILDIVLE